MSTGTPGARSPAADENGRSHPYPPSPVPTDAELWPGELPFTAFGQFGVDYLDLRAFDQDTWWVDRTGTPHRLEDMSRAYRRNVVRHLEDHAADFQRETCLRFAIQAFGDAFYGVGEPAESVAVAQDVVALSPRDWLNTTPLMLKLRSSLEDT